MNQESSFEALMSRYPHTSKYYKGIIARVFKGDFRAFNELNRVAWAHYCDDDRMLEGQGFEPGFKLSDQTIAAIEEAINFFES